MNISGSLSQWAEQFIQTVETRRLEAAGDIEPIERTPEQAAAEQAMLSGAASKNHLARLVFGGGQMEQWSAKGLELAPGTMDAAYNAISQAMAEHEANGTQPSEALFNAYQLVADNQEVPDWFNQEKADALANMTDDEIREAFENGDLYFLREKGPSNNSAIEAYKSMSRAPSLIDQLFG